MTDHINKACNAAFYHLHNLRRIKKYLSRDSLITLVHTFMTSFNVGWSYYTHIDELPLMSLRYSARTN